MKKLFIITDPYGTIVEARETKAQATKRAKELTNEETGILYSAHPAKIAAMHLHGMRYWDKPNGNTYESTRLFIYFENGKKLVLCSPLAYGQDHQATARELLTKYGFWNPKRHGNGSYPSLWRMLQDENIAMGETVGYYTKKEIER